MINPPNQLSQDTRAYFLQQGQSISKLYDILSSNLFLHYLRNWFSILIEISLYLLFIGAVLLAFLIPSGFDMKVYDNITISIEVEQVLTLILIIRIFIVLLSIPILLFAILLGRNRRKNRLIRKAFTEAEKMKLAFDQAVKNLSL